jgi:hypothetical protein
MNDQDKMRVIANDLDSMVARIEDLPAHPLLTNALTSVQEARQAVRSAASDIHHSDMRKRYGASAEGA